MKLETLLSKITPLPWTLNGEYIEGPGGVATVAGLVGGFPRLDIRKTNAPYIVHAANVLPELVEAVAKIVDSHDKYPVTGELICRCGTCRVLKPALARAETVETNP